MSFILKLLNSTIPGWQREYRFHPKRKWRFDYAHPELMIAVETEGGVWVQGRHIRGKGYINDMEKYNAAQLLGWKVLRYTPQQTDKMINDITELVNKHATRSP